MTSKFKAGIDYDTKFAYVAVIDTDSGDLVGLTAIPTGTEIDHETFKMFGARMADIIWDWNPDWFIEEPIYINNGATVIKLVKVYSLIYFNLIILEQSVAGVNNSTWKRVILGKGNANKDASLAHVSLTYDFEIEDYLPGGKIDSKASMLRKANFSDAICIAEYGANKEH